MATEVEQLIMIYGVSFTYKHPASDNFAEIYS